MERIKSSKKKHFLIAASVVVIAAVCFCVSSLVLDPFSVTTNVGSFGTGNEVGNGPCNVDINGGEKIFDESVLIVPGTIIEKDFYITNNDEQEVAYGFKGDNGSLADIVDITIKSGEDTLYEGEASGLEEFNSSKSLTIASGVTKNFTVILSYPETAGNDSANQQFDFTVGCDYTY